MPLAQPGRGERQHVVIPELGKNEGVDARFGLFDGLAAGSAEPIEIIGHRVADSVRARWISWFRNGREPFTGLGLRLRVADRQHAIRIERIIGRAKRRLLAQSFAHELGEPYSALRPLAVSERATRRQGYPIGRVAHRQLGACRAGVELWAAYRACHFTPRFCISQISHKDAAGLQRIKVDNYHIKREPSNGIASSTSVRSRLLATLSRR